MKSENTAGLHPFSLFWATDAARPAGHHCQMSASDRQPLERFDLCANGFKAASIIAIRSATCHLRSVYLEASPCPASQKYLFITNVGFKIHKDRVSLSVVDRKLFLALSWQKHAICQWKQVRGGFVGNKGVLGKSYHI